MAASAERSPESIRRWSSASDIIGIIPQLRPDLLYGARGDGASGSEVDHTLRLGEAGPAGPHGHSNLNLNTPDRRAADRLAAADPFRQCRASHVSLPGQSFWQRPF